MKRAGLRVTGSLRKSETLRLAREAGKQGVQRALEDLMARSQARAPVLTGALRDSAHFEQQDLSGKVVYRADYAVAVHENLLAHHETGEAKYLQRALEDSERALMEGFSAPLRDAF